MSWLSRVVNVFRPERVNRDLDEEIQFHLDARTADLTSRGMDPEQARAQAQRQFGNALVVRESSRDVKLWPRLESVLLDVLFGLRLCRKHATVSVAAILSLSLAIGGCTAAFSLIDALILRPLPVSDPDRLVFAVYREPSESDDSEYFSYPLFERLRTVSKPQVQLFAMSHQLRPQAAVFDDAGGQSENVYAQWVSGAAFDLLGVKPAVGRLLAQSDDLKPGQHPVAVLSYDFWSKRFGAHPSVLGRWVTIRNKPLQIVGVAEKGFIGVEPGTMTDVWAPNMMWDDQSIVEPGWTWLRIWGRLQAGKTVEQARAALQPVFTDFRRERSSRLPADQPRDRIEQLVNTPLDLRSASNGPSAIRERFARPLWLLGTLAVFVLLIACANVASLLIVRTTARDREMALRLSIGAGRDRVIQQMLVESALLSVVSCLAGAVLAAYAAPLIVDLLVTSQNIIRLDLRPDWRVLSFVAMLVSVTTFLVGLAPALRASAASPGHLLRWGSAKYTPRTGLFRPLIAAQMAFSFVVLFIGGLFLVSFANLLRTDLGFDQHNLIVVDVEARDPRPEGTKAAATWQQPLALVRETPGVHSAGLSEWGLFQGFSSSLDVRIPGRAVEVFRPSYLGVSPGFFDTMRIRLIAGRDFGWRDDESESPSAVIVNDSFARRYFPGESALGKRFFVVDKGNTLSAQEIVGVAGDTRYLTVRDAARPTVYGLLPPVSRAAIQVRTDLEPRALSARLLSELPRAHRALRMTGITPQSTLIDNTVVAERVLALISGFFSSVAIVLVMVGLYGVLSYGVAQRTREVGIRVALGARPLGIAAMVLSETGLVTLVGLVFGLGGGIVASRFITALLYDVRPSAIWSITTPLLTLLVVCSLSALLPALRAARVDPSTTLRYE